MNASSHPIRILAVDDHPLLRGGIAALIAAQPDMRLVAEASSGEEAVEQFRRHRPDIALMDLQMKGMSGIEAIIAIHAEFPAAKIIVLTNLEGDALAHRALKAGAQAYLLKGSMRMDLPETVRSVYKGAKAIDSDVAVRLAEHVSDERLSPREIEVLSLIAAGNSNKMISAQLGLSEETTKAHVKNIIAKLQAHDRTHAVTVALRRGIIQL
jgi:two-component system, NarL family, response regulator